MESNIQPGAIVGNYRLMRCIGHGSCGEVWEGYQPYLDLPVAIKIIDTCGLDIGGIDRVEQECHIGSRLLHKEHIVEVKDAFPVGDRFFIVMELMADSMDSYLRVHPHPALDLTLTWALDMCQALAEAQALGVIHCDVKPQNILLTPDAKARLSDFGIAHLRTSRPIAGDQPGTPGYQAPEQQASLPVDGGVDVYALCVVLFEIWTDLKHFRYRSVDRAVVRDEMDLLLAEHYPQLSSELRSWLMDLVLAGLLPRPERITLANLQMGLTAIQDSWRHDKPVGGPVVTAWTRPSRCELTYLTCLGEAYRDLFRDRFVHQAMEAVETPQPSVESADRESPADPLLFELVALVDGDRRLASDDAPSPEDRDETHFHPIIDLHTGLSEYRSIALLGEPGSGKTTALLWLLGTWRDVAPERYAGRLPVFASLSRYTSGVFGDFVAEAWSTSLADALRASEECRAALDAAVAPLADMLEDYLARGQVVILLDAFNELPRDAGYMERVTNLRHFVDAATKRGNWVIVSCRSQDYTEALQPLQRVEIRPLDDDRVGRFLNAYLGQDAGTALWARLNEPQNLRLREMARNPFLLAALTGVASRSDSRELPTSRAALLGQLATASLRWEERKRHPDWVPRPEQEKVLAGLALAMTLLGRTAANRNQVAQCLPEAWFFDPRRQGPLWDVVLQSAGGARLARWAPGSEGGTVAFEHQLWQEYYASLLLARLDDPEWRGLARHLTGRRDLADAFDVIRPHLHDPAWRSVTLLASTQLDEAAASQLIDRILRAGSQWEEHLYRDALLAAACLAEGAHARLAIADAVLSRLETARRRGIRPLTRRAEQAWATMMAVLDRAEELLAIARDGKMGWEMRQIAAEALETMGRVDGATQAWLGMVRDTWLDSKARQGAAERLESAGRMGAAVEAWATLDQDYGAGKGVRRAARRALKRLR